jgi:hypothetical protein
LWFNFLVKTSNNLNLLVCLMTKSILGIGEKCCFVLVGESNDVKVSYDLHKKMRIRTSFI